jgi:hypothetical protein
MCTIDREKILDIDYVFYKDIMNILGIKINYETTQLLMTRQYCDERDLKQAMQQIQDSHPFNIKKENDSNKSAGKRVTIGMLRNMGIIK